jgi:glycosyltransferase involved in cell wall biosynthesis
MLNLPWVSVAHGWTSEHLWVKLLNSLDSFLLRQSTVSIGVSPPITQYLTSIRGARRTELILNAIDDFGIEGLGTSKEIRKRFKADSKTLLIGCFGRLSAEKGQKFLIQALGLCRRRGYNFKAILLGKGPEEIRLRALVSKLGLQDSIFFEGYSSLMRDYYDAIDLLVIPSLSEGLPNVLLEAAYFNVPAISSDVGAVREVIGEGNGWLVKPGCSKALAKKIIEVETNRDSLQSVKEKVGRSLYPKFCPDERARKFAAIYHHTISTVKTTKKV